MRKGTQHSPEALAKMSQARSARRGFRHTDETKAKMRAARLANNPMKGRPHTDETRAKMRAAKNPSWQPGPEAVNWKGGRVSDAHGYVWLYMPDHPDAVGNYVAEHRLVMERKIGRRLLSTEDVHHDNEQTDDNRPDNLVLLSKGEHARLHRLREARQRRESAGA